MFLRINLFFLAIQLIMLLPAMGQKGIDQGEHLSAKSLFLSLDNNTIEFFDRPKGKINAEALKKQKVFTLSGNECNIYMQWLNPLRWELAWTDSIGDDDSEKARQELFRLLRIPAAEADNMQNAITASSMALLKNAKSATPDSGEQLTINTGFKNPDLILLFINLRTNIATLEANARIQINQLTPKLEQLDLYAYNDMLNEISEHVTTLYDVTSVNTASVKTEAIQTKIKEYDKIILGSKQLITEITTLTGNLVVSDQLTAAYIKTSLNKAVDDIKKKLEEKEKYLNFLKKILIQFTASFKEENKADIDGYYRIRKVSYDDGKQLQTGMVLNELSMISAPEASATKTERFRSKLVFRRYDFVKITVSAGIFYSSTSIKTFGVAPADNNEFTVTEDIISKNSAVTAVFANLNFGVGSQLFSPMIQLGVDPVKKTPYYLLGGGFSVPAWKVSLAAGGVWITQQKLNKLIAGQKVSSSSELDKDVSSEFNISPRGWYIGIQYNF